VKTKISTNARANRRMSGVPPAGDEQTDRDQTDRAR
jgi:hypothetical protein